MDVYRVTETIGAEHGSCGRFRGYSPRLAKGADGRGVERRHAQREVVDIASLRARRRVSVPARCSGDIENVDHRLAGPQLDQTRGLDPAHHRTAQRFVESHQPFGVGASQHDMVEPLEFEGGHAIRHQSLQPVGRSVRQAYIAGPLHGQNQRRAAAPRPGRGPRVAATRTRLQYLGVESRSEETVMAATNRAALFFEPGKPFRVDEFPIPEPAPGGITLRVKRANICGSELHIWRGDGRFGSVATPAGRILGHEATGVVHRLGEGVDRDWNGAPLAEGDRIAYQYFRPCGRCRNCMRGLSEACRDSFSVQRGKLDTWPYTRGAFADYLYLHPGQAIFKVPDHVTDTMVVSANCALAQVIMGLERVSVGPGDRVVVQGCGGLGVYACAVARQRGAELVIAIDGVDDRLELARAMGADHLIDFREHDERARIDAVKALTGGLGADVVVEVVGFAGVINEGLRMLAWGGRYLEMGTFYTGTSFACDPGRLVAQNQRIEAVASYDARSLQLAIEFLARNADGLPLDEVVVDYPLEQIETAFADQDAGRVRRASLVLDPS